MLKVSEIAREIDMHDWNDNWRGNWWWMALMMIIFWGGLIWLAVTFVRRPGRNPELPAPPTPQTPQDVLGHRLARGEIGTDDYRQHIDALNHQAND
jgi:putative membrane protein